MIGGYAMPDFAPNVTPRYRLHYRAVNRNHTAQVRAPRGHDAGGVAALGTAFFFGLFDALSSAMTDDLEFISAEYALTDSDLFFPSSLPTAVTGAIAVADFTKQDSITHLQFSGRGAGGSKVSVKVYGFSMNPESVTERPESDFIILSGESSLISDAIAAIAAETTARAIDNTQISWRAAATVKVNDAWLRKVRQGL
jgi:hypothetical protein